MKNLKEITRQEYQRRLRVVLDFISENLDTPISLEELAKMACFSPWHFHRIFSGMTGETLKSHIRRLRLERAAGRLKYGSMSVIQIALEAGFDSHEAFTRAFGTAFGVSPTEFRSSNKFLPIHLPVSERKRIKMEAEIVNFPTTPILFVRNQGPYENCHAAWEQLCSFCGPQGLLGPQTTFIGRCYDDPEVTLSENIRYDACVTVNRQVSNLPDHIQAGTIPAGAYAKTTLYGPYENLSALYSQLCGEWILQKGHEIANLPSLEIYRNSPDTTAPEDLITDIYVPLEK